MDQVLYSQILKLLSDDGYSIADLLGLLEPVDLYTNNPSFDEGIRNIVESLIQDRDGDNKFTVNDLKILSSDIMAVTSLITSLILVISSVPTVNIKSLSEKDVSDVLFKILVYVFLVAIPNYSKCSWSVEERMKVLELCIIVWNLALSSQILKSALKFAKKQISRLCNCLRSRISTSDEISRKSRELESHMERTRYISSLEQRIEKLEGVQ